MSRLGDFIDRKFTEAATCRGCDCAPGHWRENCDCTRRDCECANFQGPDTDFDDTFDYVAPDGPAEPASGKWWLRGKCSISCADVKCPPNGCAAAGHPGGQRPAAASGRGQAGDRAGAAVSDWVES